MSERWYPKESDLRPGAGRALDEAYQQRERAKCSRDDFADGWMAALRWLHWAGAFKDGRFEPDTTDRPKDGE
jgi:hypothetical protein